MQESDEEKMQKYIQEEKEEKFTEYFGSDFIDFYYSEIQEVKRDKTAEVGGETDGDGDAKMEEKNDTHEIHEDNTRSMRQTPETGEGVGTTPLGYEQQFTTPISSPNKQQQHQGMTGSRHRIISANKELKNVSTRLNFLTPLYNRYKILCIKRLNDRINKELRDEMIQYYSKYYTIRDGEGGVGQKRKIAEMGNDTDGDGDIEERQKKKQKEGKSFSFGNLLDTYTDSTDTDSTDTDSTDTDSTDTESDEAESFFDSEASDDETLF